MGWWAGEWIEGRPCEDAPCCGCCGVSLGDNPGMTLVEYLDFDDDGNLNFVDYYEED